MAHVLYLGKEGVVESKAVLGRMKKWDKLKDKTREVIELKISLQILNGIWKAYNRTQSETMVWLVAENSRIFGIPSDRALFVQRVVGKLIPFLKSLGYKVQPSIDHGSDFIWYKSMRSTCGSPVYQFSLSVYLKGESDISKIKERMFQDWEKLPESEKRKARKKKRKGKK